MQNEFRTAENWSETHYEMLRITCDDHSQNSLKVVSKCSSRFFPMVRHGQSMVFRISWIQNQQQDFIIWSRKCS